MLQIGLGHVAPATSVILNLRFVGTGLDQKY